MYLYLTARSEPEKRLIDAECKMIAKAMPDELGIALSETEVDISIAAYVKTCMEVLARTNDLSELFRKLEEASLTSDRFRVSVQRIPSHLAVDTKQVMHEVGARIGGRPDLSDPKTTFLVLITENRIWFGKVLSRTSGAWNRHSKKVHSYSSALPTRLARAMVNLVAHPGDRIIDPCCGAGTILVEAASMGIESVGYDINPKMVAASIGNVRGFQLESTVLVGDARQVKGDFDAVVTDLPYGRNCPLDERLAEEILQNLKELAPQAAVVARENMSKMILRMGYSVRDIIPVPKSSLIRHIHVLGTHQEK